MALKNLFDFNTILANISFGDWMVEADYFMDIHMQPHFYLRVRVDGKCNISGEPMKWNGRKWPLSIYMTDGEVVQTAFKAIMTAMEHEVREQFKYKGVSVFDPHYDIDKLVELRSQPDSIKEREPA